MYAPRRRRRRPVRTAVVLLALAVGVPEVVAGAAAQAGTTTAAATQVTWTPSSARPFSDPLWLPLREPARVSCTYANPKCLTPEGKPYHGYWAIDFLGDLGDPVYAAGAGVFHIGATDPSCRTSTTESAGTWGWVDHGGGLVTKYNHLDRITVREGQLVTPSTRIGTMGHSGDTAPCTTNYLHFEVRTGGITGPRVNPGTLYGCQGTTRRSYPAAFGYGSWTDMPKVSRSTPALDNGCLPARVATPSAPTSVSTRRGDSTARVSWTRPASATAIDRYVISSELWGPSFSGWHAPTYRTVPKDQLATTFRGLSNGRTYRYRVLAHNSAGNSAWSGSVKAIPAAAPLAPATDRQISSGPTYVRFGWWNGGAQGAPITSYTVRIHYWSSSGWTAWKSVKTPGDVRTYRWDGLRPGVTYQVTVRSNSSAGSSPWGVYRKIATAKR